MHEGSDLVRFYWVQLNADETRVELNLLEEKVMTRVIANKETDQCKELYKTRKKTAFFENLTF